MAAHANHDGDSAGPEPAAVDLDVILRIVDTDNGERVSVDDELWLRMALLAVVVGGDDWPEAFGVKGSRGRRDGIAEVRKRLGERALLAAADELAPGASARDQAREVLAALDLPGHASRHVQLLLARAKAFRGVPATPKRLAAILEVGRETSISCPSSSHRLRENTRTSSTGA